MGLALAVGFAHTRGRPSQRKAILMPASGDNIPAILLVGASRGLGLAMAAEFLKKGWKVVGTVQGEARTELHDLAEEHPGRIEIECLDITEADQIKALDDRLSGRSIGIRFHKAGIAYPDSHYHV